MIHIRNLVLVLLLAFLSTSYSNAQVSITGNAVNDNAWNNAVYQNNLTCWAQGDPGYCGPLPIVNQNGGINFSYGTTDLHQIKSIASILPNSGTGLQVNGFTFGFTAKNGNGWDNGQQDFLGAYVKFYNKTGAVAAEYDYTTYTNQRYNWRPFSFSENFATPYAAPELSSIRYGLVGRDNNGWAGPYGPEVMDVNFSLKYSVDPCSKNSFYSPSCAGYFDALAKLAPPQTVATNTSNSVLPPPPQLEQQPPPSSPPPPNGNPPPPGSPPTNGNPPPPNGSPPPPNGSLSPPGSAPAPNQTPTGSPNLATGPQTQQEKTSVSTVNLSFALNLVAKNAQREKEIEQQVVANAIAEAQSATTKAQQLTTQTVQSLNAMSAQSVETGQAMAAAAQNSGIATTNTVAQSTTQLQQNQSSSITGLPNTTQQLQQSQANVSTGLSTITQQPQSQASSGTGLQAASSAMFQQASQVQQTVNNIQTLPQSYQTQEVASVSYTLPQLPQQAPVTALEAQQTTVFQVYAPIGTQKQQEFELPQVTASFISDRNNPLQKILESNQPMITDFTEQREDNKNKVVQPNELAQGVDLTKMVIAPQGYASYTNFALKDAQFYEAKPIYQNQRVIDNVRVLRGLGSDQKHQQMVQDQYR